MKRFLLELDSFDKYVWSIIAGLVVAIGMIAAVGDQVGVEILSVSPSVSETEVSITADIRIQFDQPMDQKSVEAAFSIAPPITGNFRWDNNSLIFDPQVDLQSNYIYTIALDSGAKSLSGREVKQQQRWQFLTKLPKLYFLSPFSGFDRSLWGASFLDGIPYEIYTADYGIFDFQPSPDGSQIALTAYGQEVRTAEIWIIDTDGSNPKQLTNCAPGACSRPAWSPDGRYIAYENQPHVERNILGPPRIGLFDLTTEASYPVFEDDQILGYGARWSPDGRWLSFYDSSVSSIRVLNLATNEVRMIDTQLSEYWTFLNDSNTLIYSDMSREDRLLYAELWKADLVAGTIQPLFESSEEDQGSVSSPDGRWIAFSRRAIDLQFESTWQLMLYDTGSGDIRQITTDDDYSNLNYVWHPNGSMLLIHRFDRDVNYPTAEIWLYDLQTDQLTFLVENASNGAWGDY